MFKAYQFSRDKMFNSVSFKLLCGDFDSLLVKVEGVKMAVRSHGPDEAVRQWTTAGTTLNNYWKKIEQLKCLF